ncbi:MAG TPA: thymidine phosphorylase [Terriglobia bacterium]|jgi:pyrimidine-nucleoside phosphorylase/thymidine phosphorylase|nr:thymidine phosphorylase [Terriglobia bacterium]
MDAVGIIRKKRDGLRLEPAEIAGFVTRYTRGEIPDYQAAALAMAIFFQGLDPAETADLTNAILHSGQVVDFSGIPRPKVDKHSTGGVGDKTSLIIAPVAAAGGLAVPMISGRGLGHTGGTLDKLESIPGFRTRLTLEEFREAVRRTGAGLIGQTDELAPADRKLYALRDVTATVESIPLISASIMSKKLAEGIDALVLDVKVGSGAFMKTPERARELARRMVEIGTACGKRVQALLTAMNQPLGRAVGNALEVIEVLEALKGRGPADLMEVSRELTARMFVLGGLDPGLAAGRARFDQALESGAGLRKFAEIIRGQGGNAGVIEDYALLGRAGQEESIVAREDGYVAALEAEAIGVASMRLGAGRERLDSVIDPAAGLVFEKKVGDAVEAGERLCAVYGNDRSRLAEVRARLRAAIRISPEPVPAPPMILESIPA